MKCATRVPKPSARTAAAQISDELWAFGRSSVLSAALELGVFEPLARQPLAAASVASATRCSPKGIRILLDALVGMKLLARVQNKYRLLPQTERFLLRSGAQYVGGMAKHTDLLAADWRQLARSVRTGRPIKPENMAQRSKNFFPSLVRALFPANFSVSQAAARKLGAGKTRRGLRILDVAAGAAAWSMGFAMADKKAQVTALDFPPVLRVARAYARRFGCLRRYRFLPGNLEEADFGKNEYDLILLGHICHSVGARASRKLFAKCFRALRRAGQVLIAEMIPADDRRGPLQPLLFAANMLLHTAEGDTFTLGEYRGWLRKAGFRKTTTLAVSAPSPLIVAEK